MAKKVEIGNGNSPSNVMMIQSLLLVFPPFSFWMYLARCVAVLVFSWAVRTWYDQLEANDTVFTILDSRWKSQIDGYSTTVRTLSFMTSIEMMNYNLKSPYVCVPKILYSKIFWSWCHEWKSFAINHPFLSNGNSVLMFNARTKQ